MPGGQRSPSSATTPSTNAMSVAITIPQPPAPGPPMFRAAYTSAGTAMPASAASTGIAAARRSRSSPSASSRLISRPTR